MTDVAVADLQGHCFKCAYLLAFVTAEFQHFYSRMDDKERITRMYMPFYAACCFTATGFILFLFAFSSPYWLEYYDYVHSSFLQLGIWSACFNKFILPEVKK